MCGVSFIFGLIVLILVVDMEEIWKYLSIVGNFSCQSYFPFESIISIF